MSLFQPGGLSVFFLLIARSTICLLIMTILTITTPFPDLMNALKWLRIPSLMITTIALTYRFLFVLRDELQTMRRARAARTFSRKKSKLWLTLSVTVAHLFERSSERAERVYGAMCARGWKP